MSEYLDFRVSLRGFLIVRPLGTLPAFLQVDKKNMSESMWAIFLASLFT